MLVLGLNKTTLLDYPGHVAAVLFTGGCNFRCPYCHNRDIVLRDSSLVPLTTEELFAFLKKRQTVLTGVCISGGEPTLHPDLPDLILRIRELGYLVKLDTNGSNPQMLHDLIDAGLIDHCAMDIKNSPEKYAVTAGMRADHFEPVLAAVRDSVGILLHQRRISYEFRTTVVQELHDEADMCAISQWIAGAQAYFLQSYTESDGVFHKGFHAYPAETLHAYAALCRQSVPNTLLRGI